MELIRITRALKRYQLIDFLKSEKKWWEDRGVKLFYSKEFASYYAWRTITDYDRESRELHGIDDPQSNYEAFKRGHAIEEYNPAKHKEIKELYRQIRRRKKWRLISAQSVSKCEKSGSLAVKKSVSTAN